MCEISNKIAYLEGLKDGMKLNDENIEKLFTGVIDALKAISDRIDDSDDFVDEIAEQVELIGDELDEVEDFLDDVFCDDEECDCCDCDDDDFCCCDDDDDCLELTCPFCNETVCFDADVFVSGEELRCPVCNKVLFDEEK